MATTPNLPSPESYEQLLSDMLSAYAAKLGINDFNVGSLNTSFFEVVALATARASGDIFQILRDFSVDRATGDALKRLAQENNVTPVSARPATGNVNVIDITFLKIFTKIYAGANPPNIGSMLINVSDASSFPSSGSIYIGRGTPNVEGPLPYSAAPIQNGSFWTITISNPTTKFHNLGETVILAQGGNRSISSNAIALSPGVGSSPDIQYSVTTSAIILDGETEVDNVQVSALTPGASGNVPAGAIKSFAAAPFSGATVSNPLPFTTGADTETDDQLRVRIKRALASIGLGTATAVKSALIGATASDENAIIVSDSLTLNTDGSATVYIDDGTGYEAKSSGVGLESIVDSALGGEQFFQLQTGGRQAPVAKAFLQTTLTAPFDLIGSDTLAVVVGGVTYQHVFQTTDFVSPGGATAFEVTASINADTTLGFEATTAGGGIYVVIRAKAETNDTISITTPNTNGRDAAPLLGFPSNTIETLRLYKNDIPLSKDGSTASVFSQPQQLWSSTIQNGDSIIVAVDGTAPITYTLLDTDFIATGLYTSVSSTNSLESWALVFNNKITGVTTTVVGDQLKLTSNLGASNRAFLSLSPPSVLVSKGMFSASLGLESTGKASDFTLDRNTAQFELNVPLVAGDKLAAGSNDVEARIESGQISGGSINFTADAHLWILIDTIGNIVQTGVVNNTTLTVSKPTTNVVRYTSSSSSAFSTVEVGDYIIIWSEQLPSSDRLEGRVNAVTNTTLDILVTPTEYAAATVTGALTYSEGFVILRSVLAPEKFRVTAGSKTLDQIAAELQLQTENVIFTVFQEQFLILTSTTMDSTGSLLAVTSDTTGQLLGIKSGSLGQSEDSLIAFYDTQQFEGDFPLFIHDKFSAGTAANPIDSFITSVTTTVSLSTQDPNNLMCMLHPYGAILDAQEYGEVVQQKSVIGTAVGIVNDPYLRRVRAADRYYVGSPLNFGHQDTAVVVLDGDASNKSFEIPFYRRAVTNTGFPSNSSDFNAYDVDAGATANFISAFGANFDFSNFKVLMQAKKVLKPAPAQTAILYRSTKWGRSGEKITVGYTYPSSPNALIESTVVVDTEVNIFISLKSGPVSTNSINSSTQWNVTITPGVPSAGIDQVTYTWSGVGTNPSLTLSGGEYVNIATTSGFNKANTGTFRVSTQVGFAPTATSFTVQRPNGVAVAETAVPTLINNSMSLYQSSSTTAAQIVAYVTANLTNYFSATLVNDGGTSGSGVIVLSTYEDSAFTQDSVQLLDGLNYLFTNNLSGSPQFTFKNPLSLPSDVGYTFNNGEEVRFVPTTMDQVKRLISILAVSGFTTIGNIDLVDRQSRIEFATDILGSSGAIQVIGGLANEFEVPVLDAAAIIDNQYMEASVDAIAGQGIHSDQWFKLQASNVQSKITNLSSNTSVSVLNSSPIAGQATITLSGRTLTQRYFGKPRHHIRSQGDTFRVEKQGSLVCVSWTGAGTDPVFAKTLNFNDSGGGTLNVLPVTNSSDAQYIILTGNANFTELSIGDIITISGLANSENNGSFTVTGVSDDGKIIQVINPNTVSSFSSGSFTLVTNSTAGDAFTIGGNTLIAGTDFTIGGTSTITAANLANAINALSQIVAVANGNIVTITATISQASIALSYSGTGTVTVSGATLAGEAFVAGDFVSISSVSEGDSVIFTAPFSILNQGKFRVIRQYNNSIWIENANVIEEEVSLPLNQISLGFDGTTSFNVDASEHSFLLKWNGTGTEPLLGNANSGDVLTVGTDFNAANRGSFMVLRSSEKLQQRVALSFPAGSQFALSSPGKYFEIWNAGNANAYYVWFNVNGTNSDPAPGGFTGVQVNILSGDTATSVASKVASAITSLTTGFITQVAGVTVTITTTGFIDTNLPVNISMPSPFLIQLVQLGTRTFLECINPAAVTESSVLITNVLRCHRPQMNFWEYEATVAGDAFVATGAILTTQNAGSYVVIRTLSRDEIVVTGNMATVSNISLNNNISSVFVQEGVPYSGYKNVFLAASQPGAPTRNLIVFDSNNQYPKINEAAGVQIISLNKLNFSTAVRNGLDSYRYNTGLIAEANRIIYGDPRDPVTYPGVGAAGADIFTREPLTLRVQVSVDIRLLTGAPFNTVSQQVRSSVAYLINSNPVGKSIDISSIVSAVRSIPGVQSVAIDSPQYDSTHDLIQVSPSEKARIIDPTLDISVNQIGS